MDPFLVQNLETYFDIVRDVLVNAGFAIKNPTLVTEIRLKMPI